MEDLSGMTVNERLFALDKHASFDNAITSGDADHAIEILESCDLAKEAAISTVTEIFKNPVMYGYSVISK
jgi:hypothetical protein